MKKKILFAAHCGKHIHGYYPPVKERGEDENTEQAERQDVEDVSQEHLPFTVETILTLLIADGSQGRDWKHERERADNVMEAPLLNTRRHYNCWKENQRILYSVLGL